MAQARALDDSPPVIVAPSEVPLNWRFVVTVHTRGSFPLLGHTDVCLEDYAPQPHPFPLTLARIGATRLRVVGRRDSRANSVLDSVEAVVTVVP